MNTPEMTKGLPAVLFPYSHFSGVEIKKILPLFYPLRLFCPWFMESPSLESINIDSNTIDIKYPLKEMKPEENFKTLLLEYSNWMHHNQDKAYTEFLRAGHEARPSENTTWEIRRMIQNGKKGDSSVNDTLKWHLILHLAQDTENKRQEADSILTSLKEDGILFKGVIEESNDVENPVKDLPSFEADFFMQEQHLRHIFEAWFGLFGLHIREDDLLLTFNRHFMGYAEELWEKRENESHLDVISSLQFKFPDFSHLPLEDLYEIKRTSSIGETVKGLQGLLLNFGDDPIHNLPKLEKLTSNLEKSYSHEKTKNFLKITFKYFPSFPDTSHHKYNSLSSYFQNRIFFLVEN